LVAYHACRLVNDGRRGQPHLFCPLVHLEQETILETERALRHGLDIFRGKLVTSDKPLRTIHCEPGVR
jgi:hypothetical protein